MSSVKSEHWRRRSWTTSSASAPSILHRENQSGIEAKRGVAPALPPLGALCCGTCTEPTLPGGLLLRTPGKRGKHLPGLVQVGPLPVTSSGEHWRNRGPLAQERWPQIPGWFSEDDRVGFCFCVCPARTQSQPARAYLGLLLNLREFEGRSSWSLLSLNSCCFIS